MPRRLARLEELAKNLWWSWHPQARDLFRALDHHLWRESGHNPVKQLREISQEKLEAAAGDPAFVALGLPGPVAYFSAEYAIHSSLPIYAGGLGILAGDLCKEASDLGLPFVAVGFMYPQGYFHQRISPSGWQEEVYRKLDFDETPVAPVLSAQGATSVVHVTMDNRTVHVGVWSVRLGPVDLYLLDTDIAENEPPDRLLSARLYVADQQERLRQEIVLGIGGVRVLRALGIQPSVWHANEGHTAFMMLERVREEVERGASFAEAARAVKATTVFTTHTPVAAGHDVFPSGLMDTCFGEYWASLGVSGEEVLSLGCFNGRADEGFNMTAFALRMSDQHNAVSQLHGTVAQRMWHVLWPDGEEEGKRISYVTNGVHVPTWIAPEMGQLYDKHLGCHWVDRQDDAVFWERVVGIPDEELWAVRYVLKHKLISVMLERVGRGWAEGEGTAEQVLTTGALLHPGVLTIGFARRFAEYKRPTLLFHDVERLKRIVTHEHRPVQIIFAGKCHPADLPSKHLLQRVYAAAADRDFQGRVAFVEDYDMHMAHYLVQGVDVWLNTPRRLQEACGTSGMKASMNGVLHFSVPDGWWREAYNGANGWVIGAEGAAPDATEEDRTDAQSLYTLLENEIVPLYYAMDRSGVPHGWVRMVKEAIRSVMPLFCARRMVKEYTERMYIPAARSSVPAV